MVLVMLQLLERPKGVERGVRVSRRGRVVFGLGAQVGSCWLIFRIFFVSWMLFKNFWLVLDVFLRLESISLSKSSIFHRFCGHFGKIFQ